MFDDIILKIYEMGPHAAYTAIFSILLASGVGFPLPEDLPLIVTGLLISDETFTWPMALFVTMSGVLVGDTIIYWLGRRFGVSFVDKGRIPFLNHQRLERGRAWFTRFGDRVVFFARFVMGIRFAVFFLAGALKMKFWKFLLLDGLAAALSVPLWILLGEFLGDRFEDDIEEGLEFLKPYKSALTIVIALAVVGFFVWLIFRMRKSVIESKTEEKAPAARDDRSPPGPT